MTVSVASPKPIRVSYHSGSLCDKYVPYEAPCNINERNLLGCHKPQILRALGLPQELHPRVTVVERLAIDDKALSEMINARFGVSTSLLSGVTVRAWVERRSRLESIFRSFGFVPAGGDLGGSPRCLNGGKQAFGSVLGWYLPYDDSTASMSFYTDDRYAEPRDGDLIGIKFTLLRPDQSPYMDSFNISYVGLYVGEPGNL